MPISNTKLLILARKSPQLATMSFLNGAEQLTKEIAEKAARELVVQMQNEIDQATKDAKSELERNIKQIFGLIPSLQKEIHDTLMERTEKQILDNIEKYKGLDGKDGYTPIKNLDYFDGQDGANGKDADPADVAEIVLRGLPTPQDGKTPTRKELEEIIEPIASEIESRLLKFVKDNLKKIKGGGKGGGGMGNFQHETKSVSSGSTSVITTYPVSGNGFAIWGFYQGQNIVRGTHYSVGGDNKTLTLLFTPVDSTFIDLIYIRG